MLIMESALWSLMWMVFVAIAVRIFPYTIEHDYPESVRKIANITKPSPEEKLKGTLFGIIGFLILFGLLIIFALIHFNSSNLSFLSIFRYLWIICMIWNIVDLLIVDWLMICMFSFRFFLLPNTEDCEENKDYKFHFIGFLKGTIAMTIIALLFSVISYGIIYFFR